MAMRLVRGGDVRSLLRHAGVLAAWRAAALVSPVAAALDAAHAAGLVHRDVKPGNMLLDVREGRPDHVYLSDFGLSRSSLAATGLTGSGQFLGTLDYVSPEQIEGGSVDGRADQYSLACAAFEMLTGEPPFHRSVGMAVMYAQVSQPAPLLSSRLPGAPAAADTVLSKAMSKASADRYASCREFADALRAALGIQPYDAGRGAGLLQSHPVTELALAQSPPVSAGMDAVSSRPDSRAATTASPAGHAGRTHRAARTGSAPDEAAGRGGRRPARARLAGLAALLAVVIAGAVVALLASRPAPAARAGARSSAGVSPVPAADRPRAASHPTADQGSSPPAAVLARRLAATGVHMISVTVFTAATDPNHLLGRQGGYTSKAEWVDPAAVSAGAGKPTTYDRYDTIYGGSIEVYPTSAGAEARAKYLQAFARADPALSDGYDYVTGTAILRLSNYLTPSEASQYHAAFKKVTRP
jgi:hypothetical protein